MKKSNRTFGRFLSAILLFCLMTSTGIASPLGINIYFTSKAYWDGPTKSCLPRERGCCFHIQIEINVLAPGQIHGTLEARQNNEIAFSFSKREGILPETYKELLKNGYFFLNGDGTFSEDILRQLGLSSSFKLSSGNYPYSIDGDIITVLFKYK